MASIDKHVRDCKFLLGKPYTKIHLWLDQYAKMFPIGMFNDYHRTFLHNSYGIGILEDTMDINTVIAAKIHIIRDWDDHVDLRKRYGDISNIKNVYNKAIIWFNNLMNMDVILYPDIIKGWGGKALVALAK
uniref:Uncharacterized protein n=1 Tax=viral metagenome TaxID=1070528 RepID=A0A6M3JZ97_9ZZZZ